MCGRNFSDGEDFQCLSIIKGEEILSSKFDSGAFMDSVETICNTLARYKVLDADTIRTLRSRWREQNKDAAINRPSSNAG